MNRAIFQLQRQEHWTASGPPIGNSPRPSHSTPFSAAGHQPVEGQRHPLDPPLPDSIAGGGRGLFVFMFRLLLLDIIICFFLLTYIYIYIYISFFCYCINTYVRT